MNKELDETFEKAKKEQQEKLEDLEKKEQPEKPIVEVWDKSTPYECEHC